MVVKHWKGVAQRGGGGPIPRNIRGQAGWALSNLIELKMALLIVWGVGLDGL